MSRQEQLQSHLESGLRAHNQGDIEAAKAAYQRALAVAPDHPDALHLLGVALLQLGEAEAAVDYLERAARKLRDNSAVVGNLAQAYFALQRYAEAHATFRKAGRLDPRNVQFQLGVANSRAMQGQHRDAEVLLRKLAERFPQHALVWFNLGNALRDQGRADEALASYRQALQLDPRFVDARNNLAGALHKLLRFDEAEREYRACIEAAPGHLLARCNLASVLMDVGRYAEAEALCREAIALAPALGQARGFLSAVLGRQGRLLEAVECLRVAVELAPRDPKLAESYALRLTDTGFFSAGLRWFARARELNPQSVTVKLRMWLILLRHGCFGEGWREYAFRPAFARVREKYPQVALARTLPAELGGKHLCVLNEQGLGDEIFFLRYAPQLHAAGARLTYRAANKLKSVLSRVACLGQLLDETAPPLATADAVMLVGDLPHALCDYPASALPNIDAVGAATPRRDFPHRIAVFWPHVPPPLALAPLAERLAELRQRLAEIGNPPYLGLTWRGGILPGEQQGDPWTLYKEIGMAPLAAAVKDFPGTFIALQRKPQPGELEALTAALGQPLHDFTALNEDLEGMLALLAVLDEYIGVSNTNMHLRASVGKTARVLVPGPAEWRWMDAGRSSPWFPGFAIYRQSLRGDWRGALAELKRDLVRTGV